MALLRHLLKRPLANCPGQYLLRKQARLCHWLMGIGAGGEVGESGEVAVMNGLRREGRTGLVVFDVGANCGQFLKLAVNRLGDRLRAIHSFEPAAATFAELEQTAPRREGIVLNRLALGTAPGQAELYYDREKSGLASLTRRDLAFRDIEFDRHETVTLTTLDAYCADRGVTRVDWLKLDVEGHELDVLRGGARLFSRGAVDRVTFEFGGCNIDTRTFVRDFHQFFGAHGMDLFRITPGGHLHPLRRYRETEEQFATTNFLALRHNAGAAGPG